MNFYSSFFFIDVNFYIFSADIITDLKLNTRFQVWIFHSPHSVGSHFFLEKKNLIFINFFLSTIKISNMNGIGRIFPDFEHMTEI